MKEKLLKALDELLDEYDAYYIMNKHDDFESDKCTHHEQFMLLKDFVKDDELGNNALNWIRFAYDCYYKEEILGSEDTAFSYLKNFIEKSDK